MCFLLHVKSSNYRQGQKAKQMQYSQSQQVQEGMQKTKGGGYVYSRLAGGECMQYTEANSLKGSRQAAWRAASR